MCSSSPPPMCSSPPPPPYVLITTISPPGAHHHSLLRQAQPAVHVAAQRIAGSMAWIQKGRGVCLQDASRACKTQTRHSAWSKGPGADSWFELDFRQPGITDGTGRPRTLAPWRVRWGMDSGSLAKWTG
eukprot:362275-Chlamydomonas_euryale.AAC.1